MNNKLCTGLVFFLSAMTLTGCTPDKEAMEKWASVDEQKQALIGEWSGAWGASSPYRTPATLIIHEIDTANAKARCTYISAQLGKEVPVLADFIPGPNPKIEFKEWESNEFKFVLKKKVLHGTFRGRTPSGILTQTWIEMEKEPKK